MCNHCKLLKLGEAEHPRYVVILSRYQGKIMLSRHKERVTWETQGGHIEQGETPLEAAKRELVEESGAQRFAIRPLFDYWAQDAAGSAAGVVFAADIERLEAIPDSEMAEVRFFEELPEDLTYPDITPHLFRWARQMGVL